MKQNKNIMKKLSSILLALIFTTSFTMSAQDTADNSQKKTETKTECSDSKVKKVKKHQALISQKLILTEKQTAQVLQKSHPAQKLKKNPAVKQLLMLHVIKLLKKKLH